MSRQMRSTGKRVLGALFAIGLVASLVGCGPDYDNLQVTNVQGNGTVNFQKISVTEGMIVTARIEPKNDDGEAMQAHVRSRQPDTLEVAAVVNDRTYAFLGLKAGTTQIEFLADDDVVLIVEAEVLPQPAK